jgi:hypothetical protein
LRTPSILPILSFDNALTDTNSSAPGVLEEYYESVGGKEKVYEELKNGLKNKKRGRPSMGDTPNSTSKRSRKNGDHPGTTSPPATAKQAAWKPPAGSWEEDVAELDACEDEDSGKLMVYLTWKNGQKTQHETSVIYKRCPQKVPKLRLIRAEYFANDFNTDAAVLRAPCPNHQERSRGHIGCEPLRLENELPRDVSVWTELLFEEGWRTGV